AGCEKPGALMESIDADGRPLVFRQDLHLAVLARAYALGAYAGLLAEGDVDDPALVGRHRLERDHVTGLADLLRDVPREVDEHLLAAAAVALDVNAEDGGLVATLGDDGVDQVLDRGERLATATDEHAEFVGDIVVVAV